MSMDEHELVKRLQEGDEMAFSEIVRNYKDKIFNFLYHIMGDYEKAVDLSQETFIRVYFKAKKYKPIAPFSSWIYTIASNLAKTELKKMSRFKKVPLEEVLNNVNHSFNNINENREKIKQIKEALQSLSSKYKIPIILKDLEGFTQEEIAKILKVPVGTVKARISRGRAILKNVLEKKGVVI